MTPGERTAYRAFVRTHHPDRGGDPDVFVEGLARFRTAGSGPPPDQDPRYDAPVEIVADLPFPVRVAVALIRTVRRYRGTRVD